MRNDRERTIEILTPRRRPRGVTLIELLVVIAILSVLVAVVMPDSRLGTHELLQGAVRVVTADLAYARSLAVGNNSRYTVRFDIAANSYELRHSGSNTSLNCLPAASFRDRGDPADRQIVRLDDLPGADGRVRLAAMGRGATGEQAASELEFGGYGETTATTATIIWLTAGQHSDRRYVAVTVNPITGLATAGAETTVGPSQTLLSAGS